MKITPAHAERFLHDEASKHLACLLYGPDSGQVSERAAALAARIVPDVQDPFAVVEISAARLQEDTAVLADEMSAIGLGGRRLIWLRNMPAGLGTSIGKMLDQAGEAAASGCFVLMTAGELPTSSRLRQWCEKSAFAASIGCYAEEGQALARRGEQALAAKGFRADRDALNLMAARMGGDRGQLQQAVEKLALYAGDQTHISLEMADQCLSDGSESSLEHVAMAVARGDLLGVQDGARQALEQHLPPVAILRAVYRHMRRVQEVSHAMDTGSSADMAVKGLKPPVFFKLQRSLAEQAKRWHAKPGALDQALLTLYQTEIDCKKSGRPVELLCIRALLRVSRLPHRPKRAA